MVNFGSPIATKYNYWYYLPIALVAQISLSFDIFNDNFEVRGHCQCTLTFAVLKTIMSLGDT